MYTNNNQPEFKLMKKILVFFCVLVFSLSAVAQDNRKIDLGIHIGLDFGAAVPWPISDAIGGGDKMNAVPQLTPGFGFSGEYHFSEKWSAVIEATYKSVGLDASIITLNSGQKFKDDGVDVIFYGKAKTTMSFTMLELPLSAKYKINENNRVFMGGYFAYILNSKFNATAMNGYLKNPEIPEDITVVNPNDPLYQDFSSNLRHWDAGWQIGYERKIQKRISLSGKFSMGLVDIFKPGENYLDYSMLNMRGTVMLSYRLF